MEFVARRHEKRAWLGKTSSGHSPRVQHVRIPLEGKPAADVVQGGSGKRRLQNQVKARTMTASRNRKQSVKPAIANKRFGMRSTSMP